SRSSQRPSLSATTERPFCTVALLPSMSRRYSPAVRSALPSLAACVILIILLTGFASTGMARAKAADNATLRKIRLDFIQVHPFPDRVSRNRFVVCAELTRGG